MTAPASVREVLAGARRRVAFDAVLVVLPVVAALAILAWRIAGPAAGIAVAVAGLLAGGFFAVQRVRPFDRDWLALRLDAERRDLDDSSGLLFADAAALGPVQRLQRNRVLQRIHASPLPDLRPRWSRRTIGVVWLASLALAAAALLWPAPQSARSVIDGRQPAPVVAPAGEPRLLVQSLQVHPPAYTGLAVRRSESLDAKAPTGSTLKWTLRYVPQPTSVELVFHDGRRLPLRREGADWTTRHVLQASTLYRVVAAGVAGAGDSKLHRLDPMPDQPPRVRVLAPERGLTLMEAGQREWRLQFEVEDDHGVSPRARLQVTRTEGTGENLRFHDHVLQLQGSGERRRKRFSATLSPSDYGLQRGEDLVARLEVSDNRVPQPQQARSASVILRWPAEPVLGAEGLDGLARQVLPAYFRSQRQIIIDAEALLQAKPRLAADEFERRSDAIGVDQRLLRLRYGQFLGEQSDGAPTLPTSDLPTSDLPTSDLPADETKHDDEHAHAGQAPAHAHADEGATQAPAGGFGVADDVLETFGHTHDIPEAATLLDPQTRETLRAALREMWQSELHLRQAVPDQALPYAHRALELIKQVQQADRIYLQRVGAQLPPIDESRRLTGKRDGLGNRPLPTLSSRQGDEALATAWRSLQAADAEAAVDELDALQEWVDANRDRVVDPLAWIARIDELRRDPGCADCRADLRALLWGAMPRPAGGISRRTGDDADARRYLDALRRGDGEP